MITLKETAFETVSKLEQQLKALNFVTTGLYHISKRGNFDESDFTSCEASIENIIDAIELIKNDLQKVCLGK